MNQINVGIGEFAVSNNSSDVIKTFALGSCVAVIAYDKICKVAGLLHVALPESKINLNKSKQLPGYFADTGLPILMTEMKKKGANLRKIWIKLIGGANVIKGNFSFDIGKRNSLAIKKILWRYSLGIIKEEIGGKISRTVDIDVKTGRVSIYSRQVKKIL